MEFIKAHKSFLFLSGAIAASAGLALYYPSYSACSLKDEVLQLLSLNSLYNQWKKY